MMNDLYRTIEAPAEGIYKEKGSKFLAFIYPVTTEEDIKNKIDGLKDKFYDARHHCFAWMLGADKKRFRANDDSEPSSTAGKPILGQILSADITDVLIVVVRYFGGTKLGVSGLINAYKTAAADAIANASIIEQTVQESFIISFAYAALNDVLKIIKEEEANILSRDFALECKMSISVRLQNVNSLKTRLEKVEVCFLEEKK